MRQITVVRRSSGGHSNRPSQEMMSFLGCLYETTTLSRDFVYLKQAQKGRWIIKLPPVQTEG